MQDFEKSYAGQKDKEKKQLDAEICFDNWVKKAHEEDIIKRENAERKSMKRSLTEKRKYDRDEQKKELSHAKVNEWMYYKGFVEQSAGRQNIFDRLAKQNTRNFKKRASQSQIEVQSDVPMSDYRQTKVTQKAQNLMFNNANNQYIGQTAAPQNNRAHQVKFYQKDSKSNSRGNVNDQKTTVTSNNQTTMQSDKKKMQLKSNQNSSSDQMGSHSRLNQSGQKHIKNKSPYGITPERQSNYGRGQASSKSGGGGYSHASNSGSSPSLMRQPGLGAQHPMDQQQNVLQAVNSQTTSQQNINQDMAHLGFIDQKMQQQQYYDEDDDEDYQDDDFDDEEEELLGDDHEGDFYDNSDNKF